MRRKILFLSVALAAFVSSVFLTYLFCFTKSLDRSTTVSVIKPDNTQSSPPAFTSVDTKENRSPQKKSTPTDSVDFDDFAFPVCPRAIKKNVPKLKSIKLRGGELKIEQGQFGSIEPYLRFSLEDVSYDDLTNDDRLEAVVTIAIKYFQGREECTFIYSLNDKKNRS